MPSEEKCKLPCADHKAVFYSVAGFYCLVCLTMITYMVANDRRGQASQIKIAGDLSAAQLTAKNEHAEMMDKVIAKINDNNEKVIQRLSRIEAKIP